MSKLLHPPTRYPQTRLKRRGTGSKMGASSALEIEAVFDDPFVRDRLDHVLTAGNGRVWKASNNAAKVAFAAAVRNFPREAFEPFEHIFALCDQLIATPTRGVR